MSKPRSTYPDVLDAALAGLEAHRQKVNDQIAQLNGMISARAIGRGIRRVARPIAPIVGHAVAAESPKRSILSPEARQKIAAAQRKRWAAVRKAAKKAKQA
jgi:hypothetical protein